MKRRFVLFSACDSEMSVKEKVTSLLHTGGAKELHQILMGMSPFCQEDVSSPALTDEEQELWTLAVHHLAFVAENGLEATAFWREGLFHCPYPEEFQKWLEMNAPGLAEEDLDAYLASYGDQTSPST